MFQPIYCVSEDLNSAGVPVMHAETAVPGSDSVSPCEGTSRSTNSRADPRPKDPAELPGTDTTLCHVTGAPSSVQTRSISPTVPSRLPQFANDTARTESRTAPPAGVPRFQRSRSTTPMATMATSTTAPEAHAIAIVKSLSESVSGAFDPLVSAPAGALSPSESVLSSRAVSITSTAEVMRSLSKAAWTPCAEALRWSTSSQGAVPSAGSANTTSASKSMLGSVGAAASARP
mmetsp:Transcript_43882/g.103809  ORF Transcript_43882/g.103809 Transcript_43882/m.103809 type:complete len:232 (+) Transcript_43882:39-734(+)